MELYQQVLDSLQDRRVLEIRVGLRWTAVVVDKGGQIQCGLASTLETDHTHSRTPSVPEAGQLEGSKGIELAEWIGSEVAIRKSIGCAAINALLDYQPERWVKANAVEAIRTRGKGKKVVLIGHFPFVKDLKEDLEDFTVLELNPTGDDLPASSAPDLLPMADVVAITGMTFINGTLGNLLELCQPNTFIILLGPTTPLSPVLHDQGVDLLAGSVVRDVPAVLRVLSQGGNFHQLHQAGVQLVLQAEDSDAPQPG